MLFRSFADMIGQRKIAALDLAAHYRELSDDLKKMVCERIDDEYGLEVSQLFIVNVSLPEEVEKALDTRSSIGVMGDLNRFQQYQMGQAIGAAANNPAGGGAADGMGLGMGFAMAQRFMQMGGASAAPVAAAVGAPVAAPMSAPVPPPVPQVNWHVAINGQSQGPYSTDQLIQGARLGQVAPSTLVWTAGLDGWKQAAQVPQLAAAFQQVPPPPPPM